jgi:outer membrane protein assembly factor BamB
MDSLYCLRTSDGSVVWQHRYPSPLDDRFFEGGPTASPTLDQDRVFYLSRGGEVGCLDAKSGDCLWSKNLPEETGVDIPGWGFAGSPVILGDWLVLNVGQSGFALDKTDGSVRWQSEGEAGYLTPLLVDLGGEQGRQWITASGKFFYGIGLEGGEVLWRYRWLTNFGCNAADPIYHQQRLFISSGYNRGSALLDLSQGAPQLVWETKEFQNQWSSSILLEGFLYGVDGNDTGEQQLKCIGWDDGQVRWSVTGLGAASLLASQGKLLVLSDRGELVIAKASPAAFDPGARAQIISGKCWTVPTLANGRLYVRNASGEVVAIDLRKPPSSTR